jgi:peptide-methionine (R)-S-oxide reductase
MTRRDVLLGGAGVVAAVAIPALLHSRSARAETFEVTHSDDEWKRLLTPAQYQVLRKHGTERPFTSPLNDEHRTGVFSCTACDLPVYRSETKFDSGTGWPSFYAPIEDAVRGRMRE